MLELKDFIAATLREIVEGVGQARALLSEHGTQVAPLMSPATINKSHSGQLMGHTDMYKLGQNVYAVEFDVEISYAAESGADAKVGVLSGILNAGGGLSKKDSDAGKSRVKFTIPIALPNASGARLPDLT